MQQLDFEDGVRQMFDSLLAERLVLLAGAGLSMAPPSSLPSAARIAQRAKQKYDGIHGPGLPVGIEDQAEFFFQRGELASVYFRTLIDAHAFAAPPNEGHAAIADLMLVKGIKLAVTTNVDVLVETAGQMLFGQVEVGLDGMEVAGLPAGVSPLLKIHGCRQKDHDNMVWAPGQLTAPPVSTRVQSSALWLAQHMLNRDLLVVGYWTDWDYLNQVLSSVLDQVQPSRVVVVDLADSTLFEGKAPDLYALGQSVHHGFHHVKASGADFLAALRLRFSRSFVRQVMSKGSEAFEHKTGGAPTLALMEPPNIGNDALWHMRRDLEGSLPNQPATLLSPPDESTLGLTLLQLRSAGAIADGPYWLLNNERIRILRTPNELLHRVKAARERETAPTVAPDIVVAVGAEDDQLPANIARAGEESSITRGAARRWLTRAQAIEELNL